MANINCCVVGCPNTYDNSPTTWFYSFPDRPRERRQQWIAAVRRESADGFLWQPTQHSKICSHHFVNGEKSNDPRSPAYVPTLFPSVQRPTEVPTADRLQSRDEHEQPTSSCVSPVPDDRERGGVMAEHTSGATSVDIKVEQSSPPTSPPPWLICVDVKEEPNIPPTTDSPDVSADIKVEWTSPQTLPAFDLNVDIRIEPSGPTATPPPGKSIDIKVEPSSPTAASPPEHADATEEGAAEAAPSSSNSEASSDTMDSGNTPI
ncbi:uncharacterized protein LOC119178673 isoform X6 [Rhipicephalus microplus]|uniref:uncharacterized protein LOC119178673 isoform X6 n=1 Tax=Rhipicephalus microplus TaxID=6941 RepID=UPI003F6D7C7A